MTMQENRTIALTSEKEMINNDDDAIWWWQH